jgi:hypothetical protein
METTINDKRNQEFIQHMKKIQDESPGMAANLVLSKEEDLSLEDLHELFNALSRVQEDSHRFPLLHHGHKANIGGQSLTRNMVPPLDLSYNHLQATHLSQQSSLSHHPHQQSFLSVPLPSPPEENLAPPLRNMNVPQIFHTTPLALAPPLTSPPQQIPDPINELPSPQDLDLQSYAIPCNTEHPPHNYVEPNITFNDTLEDSALLVNSSVDYFSIDGPCGYDSWGYPLSDNIYFNGFLGVDAYLGYNGTNVGQSSIRTD